MAENRYLMEDRNGRMVWVPASKLEEFEAYQKQKQTEETQKEKEQMKSALLSKLLGSKE